MALRPLIENKASLQLLQHKYSHLCRVSCVIRCVVIMLVSTPADQADHMGHLEHPVDIHGNLQQRGS